MDFDFGDLWGGSGFIRSQHANHSKGPHLGCSRHDQQWVSGIQPVYIKPVYASGRRPPRRQRVKPHFAGSRPRHSPADAVSRLCWSVYCLCLCGCRTDWRGCRPVMGKMDAPLDHGGVVRADIGNRTWQLVGIL